MKNIRIMVDGKCSEPFDIEEPNMPPKQAMHTPTPWRIYKEPMNPNPRIMAEASTLVAVISQGKAFAKKTDTNAAFIVRAVNAYDGLVNGLKDAKIALEELRPDRARVQNALARLELTIAKAEASI